MGGKKQRTKNNVKPSSSSRSAELLGSKTPSFVGFSAHTDQGLVPVAPGFTATELTDVFDANISPEYQMVFRKMSKKDPMTKSKALQEFIEMVKDAKVDALKEILPIWPKYYQNLANDIQHNVRELAQMAMKQLVMKCKKYIAPYLKQLVPVWITSFYDAHAPAGTIAQSAFQETFMAKTDRAQEVCLHCQFEIIEYVKKTLINISPNSFTQGKHLTPEESVMKYSRLVRICLQGFTFFILHTRDANLEQAYHALVPLLNSPKFWTYGHHKVLAIKAAWYEAISELMQNDTLRLLVLDHKDAFVYCIFLNLFESDPLVAPHVWANALQMQMIFDDWHKVCNFSNTVLTKLLKFISNNFGGNTEVICPNILPFFTRITADNLDGIEYNEFCKMFFDSFQSAMLNPATTSNADMYTLIRIHFECIRFIYLCLGSPNMDITNKDELALHLLDKNLATQFNEMIKKPVNIVQEYFKNVADLAAYWARQRDNEFYAMCLKRIWDILRTALIENFERDPYDTQYLRNAQITLQAFSEITAMRKPSMVRFADDEINDIDKNRDNADKEVREKKSVDTMNAGIAEYISQQLRPIVLELTKLGFTHLNTEATALYVRCLTDIASKLYSDEEFFKSLTSQHTLDSTMQYMLSFVHNLNGNICPYLLDLVFKVLENYTRSEAVRYIEKNLLSMESDHLSDYVMAQLLKHPYRDEPEVIEMMATPNMQARIMNMAQDAKRELSKNKADLLAGLFHVTAQNTYLIGNKLAESVIMIMSEALTETFNRAAVKFSLRFFKIVLPPLCKAAHTQTTTAREHALNALFRLCVINRVELLAKEEILWYEIHQLWRDNWLLCDHVSRDLIGNCVRTLFEYVTNAERMEQKELNLLSTLASDLIICCAWDDEDNRDWLTATSTALDELLRVDQNAHSLIKAFKEYCLFYEAMHGLVAIGDDIDNYCIHFDGMLRLLRLACLKQMTIMHWMSNNHVRIKNLIGYIETKKSNNDNDNDVDNACQPGQQSEQYETISNILIEQLLWNIHAAAAASSLLLRKIELLPEERYLIYEFSLSVKQMTQRQPRLMKKLKDLMMNVALVQHDISTYRSLMYLYYVSHDSLDGNKCEAIVEVDDLFEHFKDTPMAYIYIVQYSLLNIKPRTLDGCFKMRPLWTQLVMMRCCLHNYFIAFYNENADSEFIAQCVELLTDIQRQQSTNKLNLLYKEVVKDQAYEEVSNIIEYMKLLRQGIKCFPHQYTLQNWDSVRIGLSAWVLSVSKSIQFYYNPKTALFVVNVFRLFSSLTRFIAEEKQKSSTALLQDVIEEWERLFEREINLVLFKAFFELCKIPESDLGVNRTCYNSILEYIADAVKMIDYSYVYEHHQKSSVSSSSLSGPSTSIVPLETITKQLLSNLASPLTVMRLTCMRVLKKLIAHYVQDDIRMLDTLQGTLEEEENIQTWHLMSKLDPYIRQAESDVMPYIEEFKFNVSDLDSFSVMDDDKVFTYMHTWDCVIWACANAPLSLRSTYTSWLSANEYDKKFFKFLFRAMPPEILKNYELRTMSSDIFKEFNWDVAIENLYLFDDMENSKPTRMSSILQRYACCLYTEVLRRLPAAARKWWNTSDTRTKTFVDKLTTHFVSPIICAEELKSISLTKDKHENMTVKVHNSTREVFATYAIDEARMELIIQLAQNYPLGGVKVECGKQIGGRLLSRNVGMQLTLFLTHQNGTIFDGLTLWKNNLDKKFEGVEECYVCYTVIHQDTCKLPKLTCRTCKKKFHSPCLYKWFTTSNKSTCPICRNIF